MQTYPLQSFYICKAMQQVWQHSFFINIKTVVSKFLRYQHNFFYTTSYQTFGFFDDLFNCFTYMPSTHKGNGTECTSTITTFRYFQISIMLWRRQQSFTKQLSFVISFKLFQ